MAIYPRAVLRLLPESSTQPRITPTQVILHTAVSGADSLFGSFNSSGNVLEAHFYVRNDGTVEQYMDTGVRADANYRANMRAISIESEDNGHPENTPWSAAQLAALRDLIAWCVKTHKIPVRQVTGWDKPGIGWHALYAEWNPNGHSCPGPVRIKQIPALIQTVVTAVNPPVVKPPVIPTTKDVPVTDADIQKIVAALLTTPLGRSGPDGKPLTVAEALQESGWAGTLYRRGQAPAAPVKEA